MKHMGGRDYQLWDEHDGFFYDVLRYPDGRFHKFRVRSLVGLIPLFAVERLEVDWIEPFKEFSGQPRLVPQEPPGPGRGRRPHASSSDGETTHVLTIVNQDQIVASAGARLGPGRVPVRLRHPQPVEVPRASIRSTFDGKAVGYEPAEAVCKIKGGNSNWRGPIWFPTSFLLIESLRKLGKAYGTERSVCPCRRRTSR